MGGLEGWSAGTRGMDVALLWRAAARKRVECACVRIVHVDRRFDTPASTRPPSSGITEPPGCQLAIGFGETVRLKSPDQNYTLQMTVVHPDWKNQRVTVSVWPFLTRQSRPVETDTAYRFPLGWFDFPFTDNTLLPDGNRFAIYLRLVSAEFEKVTVVAMWFPK